MTSRPGLTLIELIVVLVVLGIMAGVVGLAMPGGPQPPMDDTAARVFAGRREALHSGKPVIVWLADSGGASSAIALPDGSVVGDSVPRIDRFTGHVVHDSAVAR